MPVEIIVPPLSQTSDSLLLLDWLKKPGDKVLKGEALFTVETDKASLEVEAPGSGILFEVYAKPQTEVAVRSVIGMILKEGETLPEMPDAEKAETPTLTKAIQQAAKTPETKKPPIGKKGVERLFASPRARKIAHENNLEISRAIPTGVRGMIVEQDVRLLMNATQSTPQTKAAGLSHVRQIISKRMLESHLQTAPVSYMREVDATQLVTLRNKIISSLKANEIRPTYTDLLIHVLCKALLIHPQLNATFENGHLTPHNEIHMALAVDTDRGLIVPVIQNAQNLTINQIAQQRDVMVKKVVSGKISSDDLEGGTITLTNLGTLGIDFFTPIINPPQVAILGIGRIREIPAVKDGGIYIESVLGISLTCDHRIIDGAPAARFLETICKLIENPKDEWRK